MEAMLRQYERLTQLIHQKAFSNYTIDPATDAEIADAEGELGAVFPDSYKRFQRDFGYFRGAVPDVYTVRPLPHPMLNIVGINFSERNETYPNLPLHLIAFSDNSAGDSFCFDTLRLTGGECPVVFWDHEKDTDQQPEEWAENFLDWLDEELNS